VTGELALLDATAQAELVRAGQVSAAELVTAAIGRIEALNPVLNAVVTPVFDRAAEAARAGPAGPFAGVPYLVKDLACEMEGVRFTEGSRFLADNVSAFDSELVLRLRRAGLVILGKTSTPEFGMAPACEPVLFGPTRGTRSVPPAGPAADRRPRWRRAWCRSRTVTTWAARCATRRPRAACSPSSRPGHATRSGPSTATSPRAGRPSMR
jgi:Amidase